MGFAGLWASARMGVPLVMEPAWPFSSPRLKEGCFEIRSSFRSMRLESAAIWGCVMSLPRTCSFLQARFPQVKVLLDLGLTTLSLGLGLWAVSCSPDMQSRGHCLNT